MLKYLKSYACNRSVASADDYNKICIVEILPNPPIQSKTKAIPELEEKSNESNEKSAGIKIIEAAKLYVYGIPTKMHEDWIKDYFSLKKNGGGVLSNFERNAKEAVITFQDPQGRIKWCYNVP